MSRHKAIILAALFVVGGTLGGAPQAAAQTFQRYHCADGTEFILGFFQYDGRAYLQIDGKAVTLDRRLTLSGRRYSASGITLRMAKSGTTVKHLRRRLTTCELS